MRGASLFDSSGRANNIVRAKYFAIQASEVNNIPQLRLIGFDGLDLATLNIENRR